MEAHSGAIRVGSAPGEGTTFELFFPLHAPSEIEEKPERAAPETEPPATQGRGERILFVDDEPSLVFMGRLMLEAQGYQVEGVTDVLAALQRVRDLPAGFDLVVSDVSMPGMTGVEFARVLREIRPGLPIILTTGLNLAPTLSGQEQASVGEVLHKPFSLKTLAETVHRALARSADHPARRS